MFWPSGCNYFKRLACESHGPGFSWRPALRVGACRERVLYIYQSWCTSTTRNDCANKCGDAWVNIHVLARNCADTHGHATVNWVKKIKS